MAIYRVCLVLAGGAYLPGWACKLVWVGCLLTRYWRQGISVGTVASVPPETVADVQVSQVTRICSRAPRESTAPLENQWEGAMLSLRLGRLKESSSGTDTGHFEWSGPLFPINTLRMQ